MRIKLIVLLLLLCSGLCAATLNLTGTGTLSMNVVNSLDMTVKWIMGNNNDSTTVFEPINNKTLVESVTVVFTSSYAEFDNDQANYLSNADQGVLNSANLSIAIKFTPDFETDANDVYVFFDTDDDRHSLLKLNNGGSNALRVQLDGSVVLVAAEGTYSPYWNVGEENIIVIAGTTGNTSMTLNGVVVASSAAAWASSDPTTFFVGGNATQGFDGKIYYLKIWNRILTDAEIGIISNDAKNTMYAPIQSGLIGYYTLDTGDINGTVIYDRSVDGVDGTAAGAAATLPARIKEGMSFNGATQNVSITATNWRSDVISAFAWIKMGDLVGRQDLISSGLYSAFGTNNWILNITGSEVLVYGDTVAATTVTAPIASAGVWYHVGFTNDGSNTIIYVDGVEALGSTAQTINNNNADGEWLGGDVLKASVLLDEVRVYDIELTPAQVLNLYKAGK